MTRDFSRRELLKRGGYLAAAAGSASLLGGLLTGCGPTSKPGGTSTGGATASGGASATSGAHKDIAIKTIGLGVTVQDRFMKKFMDETGYKISGTTSPEVDAMNRMITTKGQEFDVVEINAFSSDAMWNAGVLQPIPVDAIPNWKDASELFRQKLGNNADVLKLVFTDEKMTHFRCMPTVYDFDSFGYRPDLAPNIKSPTTASWGDLFDPKYAGHAAIGKFPTQVPANTAIYFKYHKMFGFDDKVNPTDLTPEQYDTVVNWLIQKKKAGHFKVLWEDYGQLVNLFATGEVTVSDSWQPVIEDVKKQGKPCKYAEPIEGTRAWYIGIMVSKKAKNLDACYAYMNWWMEGWVGAQVAESGYYSPTVTRVQKYLSPEAFGYWYEGKPNAKGESREGGSYSDRFKRIAAWDHFPANYKHYTEKWTEFLNA